VSNMMIADLVSEPFEQADPDEPVAEALRRTAPGHVLVVVDPDIGPRGIFTREMLQGTEPATPLVDLLDRGAMPTVTSGGTRISDLLVGMAIDTTIGWHVVMVKTRVAGVAAPRVLLEEFASARAAGEAWTSKEVYATFRPDAEVFGTPATPPPNICYCCHQKPPQPQHCVGPHKIRHRTPRGRALCPIDGTLTTVKNPCR
jgi:hypothetical protein